MSSTHKPAGYPTVSPYLIVDGAVRTIEFLRLVFDAVEISRFPAEEGRLMHAEVRLDDGVVMLADGGEDWPPLPGHVHVYVADVDATFRRAVAAGATAVQEPVEKEDADERAASRTPAAPPGGSPPGSSEVTRAGIAAAAGD